MMTKNDFPPADQLADQLKAFMEEHIYPNEELYQEQLNSLEDRFSTVPLMDNPYNTRTALRHRVQVVP